MTNSDTYDFLIIGSGLAGLFAAYHASKYGTVLVVTKINEKKSNSWLAQGGIAAAMGEDDSTELHIKDTLEAGRGICDKEAVRILVEEGVLSVKELIEIGMKFDKENGQYVFGLEGGHCKRRILHSNGSSTGSVLTQFLLHKVKNLSNVTFHSNTQVIDLIRESNEVVGIISLNLESSNVSPIFAKATILATGGYNNIYSRNTNPEAAIGEGISMALNVGAELQDLEFTQFHPTAFYSESGSTFLISEAIRGEGAYLINTKGERFMSGYHELGELAPRDIVAKAIYEEIKKSDKKYVYLDARHLEETAIKDHFKNIYNFALAEGTDITSQLIPIAPAAHYSIGGIKTDNNGSSSVGRLFAIGEAASTRIHGANRLASNSLLECLVFAKRAAIKASESTEVKLSPKQKNYGARTIERSSIEHYLSTLGKIQKLFTDRVGILKNEKDLSEALIQIKELASQIPNDSSDIYIRKKRNLLLLSESIVKSALHRQESRRSCARGGSPHR